MRFATFAAFALFLCTSVQADPGSQLDSLAGSWEIRDPTGKPIGTSQIVVQAPEAMIYEMRQVGDEAPQPIWFSQFERHGKWSQLFVGANGSLREFVTQSAPGVWPIVMAGDVILRDKTPARFRLTMFQPSDTNSRRMLEISRDAGATWNTVFEYEYVRRSKGASPSPGR